MTEGKYFAVSSQTQGVFAVVRVRKRIELTKRALSSAIAQEYDCENLRFDLEEIKDFYRGNTEININYIVDGEAYTDIIELFETWIY